MQESPEPNWLISQLVAKSPDRYWSPILNSTSCSLLDTSSSIASCTFPNGTGNPFHTLPALSTIWDNLNSTLSTHWAAPDGLFWICGKRAYSHLPSNWTGSCTLGIIQPGFFLLPNQTGQELGTPLYQDLHIKPKRSLDMGGHQTWRKDEWPPQRIIQYYGPATWDQDGSWGYCTPIYMLNRIIRLQAVLEIITNETATALELLAAQQTQTWAAIYQNRLALDYLLADEGGVCGKFNQSDCCLQIDDTGKAVSAIATNIRKLAHVPVQKWSGWDPESLFGGWISTFGGFKMLIGIVLLLLGACLLLPCILPLVIRSTSSLIETTVERKTAAKVLMLWRYQPLGQQPVEGDDAL
ncbi:endogenous retrovirus group 3 member 1 Env polyprotein-like [Hipposideros larvatus]